jgi:hypothetical protein
LVTASGRPLLLLKRDFQREATGTWLHVIVAAGMTQFQPWPCFDRRSHSIPDSDRGATIRAITTGIRCGAGRVRRCNSEISTCLRTQLNTRRLMPVRLRGYQHEDANAEGRIFGRFNEMWYLEPLPTTQSNEVRWVKVDDLPSWDDLETDLRVIRRESPGSPFIGRAPRRLRRFRQLPASNEPACDLLWKTSRSELGVGCPPISSTSTKSVISYQTLSTGSSPIPRRSRG